MLLHPPATAAFMLIIVAVILPVNCLPASVLQLHRAFPPNERVELDVLRARDAARHARILQSSGGGGVGGVVDFVVQGTSDPFLVGLYFTRVKLGTPPREYNVQIDTGSDILWVTCNSCSDCPRTSGLGVELHFYDNTGSSTANLVSCSDPICTTMVPTSSSQCSADTNPCRYSFQYGDGSGTSGSYISDMFYFDMIFGNSMIANSSASIVFGCSTYQSGDLTKSDRAIDGIFGFGQHGLSVVSQLSSRGITPRSFSHCLKGEGNGGGILVLGEILDPSIVYSPLVPSQPHYNLDLQSISVNGQLLSIDQSAFATSNNRGTIVDSGTTLAYLIEEAYDPFVKAITEIAVSQSTKPLTFKGNQCYLVYASLSNIFPPVSLNFAGGASMVLRPEEYLMHMGYVDGAALWCMGFQKVQDPGVTILGDLVLKDKIFVYDLARQRIGWANYDCSMSVNVSVTFGRDEFINAGQLSVSSSSKNFLLGLVPPLFEALVAQIIAFLIL
ncbi:aspartic proteinase 36-like isoform X1 [Amaranthus tricolor]|uniref:aspartic proteinase 36-like isoform X1 n=1 Tax=Amaranthus tricolor TaxID=29722 RepID=UPI0025857C82|nr:aspartic proteinase 36-like isoform X1 [Amaranthus tricolor]